MESDELTLRPFFWRATNLFPEKSIISRTTDGIHRYTYAGFGDRVRSLAAGLSDLGVTPGDRIGTFGWNHHRHFEAYYSIPLMGAQFHTINVLLHDDHIVHIINDAADDILVVDPGDAFETIERVWDRLESVEQVIVMDEEAPDTGLDVIAYEDLIGAFEPSFDWPPLSEEQPAGMCYTSGTTGKPKGVEYTQKMLYAHSMMIMTPAAIGIEESDVVMPVVPMFHINSWEFPYAVTMTGAKQVYPGPSPDPADLAHLIEAENVTLTAGVPTVWIDLLDYLDDASVDISSLERIIVGGSAAPEGVMRQYEDEYGVTIDHAWGMTETMSIGSASRPKSYMTDWDRADRYEKRSKQGLLSPGLEMKVIDDDGNEVEWDGTSFGELYVRGPTVVGEHYNRPDVNETDFEDGWFKTGDIVTVDEDGFFDIVDRAKDVIKSGGEWISSIALENQLMAHDDIVEAAVIAVPHERWQERPLACVVTAAGAAIDREDLRSFLADDFPNWWLPDNIVFISEVPKTATGKFDKKVLRDEYEGTELAWTPGENA